MSLSNPRRTPAQSQLEVRASASSSSLTKGATFHTPSAPSSSAADHKFLPPSLPRSQSDLDDALEANNRRIAFTLSEIDETLAMTEKLSLSSSPKDSKYATLECNRYFPGGMLASPLVDPSKKDQYDRRMIRPRSLRNPQQAYDSGIGSSVASSLSLDETKDTGSKVGSASAITRSVAASRMESLPKLSPKAVSRVSEHIIGPLLEKDTLKEFNSIVLDVPRRINTKEIICLRDVEKTLLFMAPVSQLLLDTGVWGDAYRILRVKEKAESTLMYLDFCLTSIRCIQATVEYLSDREQVRPGDRPYTNGYFLDLKEQIFQYGRDLAAAKEDSSFAGLMDLDQYVPVSCPRCLNYPTNTQPRNDEVKLYGGFAENGRPAELVRVKQDGTIISMATGKTIDAVEGPMQFKRSLSEQREDDEEIMRSMARRKKNASPEELAPKRCREPGCTKEFKRPCDLTKHEKTHSRPWKCPHATCKYHEFGWPTEKEMDRHINDKHSDAPAMFECQFKPCPYKSKRESNCKQHMEKAHGWTYVRTKTNGGKKIPTKPGSSVQTPPLGNVSTPSTTPAYSVSTPNNDTTPPPMTHEFPIYQPDSDWFATYGMHPDNIDTMDLALENPSPASAASYEQYPPYQNGSAFIINDEDIYAATARIPAQLPSPDATMMYGKMMPHQQLPLQQPQMHAYEAPRRYVQQPQNPQHFSPTAQQNTMLYTPPMEADEQYHGDGGDFPLFPPNMNMGKGNSQTMYGELPSADMGFSQQSQPEMFQHLDLSQLDYNTFHN